MNAPASALALIPVSFRNANLTLIEHDGQPFVAMRPVVEGMGLAWQSQHVKLNSNPRWGVTEIVTPSNGGPQNTICMPLRKLPGWMNSIHPNKVRDPVTRENVIAFQDECDDVLWAHWSQAHPAANGDAQPRLAIERIDNDQQQTLRELINAVVECGACKTHGEAWERFKHKFRVPRYDELPASQFDEAVAYLRAKLPRQDEATALQIMVSQRFLLSFDNGSPKTSAIPQNAVVATPEQMVQIIADPGSAFPPSMLADVINVASARLARLARRAA